MHTKSLPRCSQAFRHKVKRLLVIILLVIILLVIISIFISILVFVIILVLVLVSTPLFCLPGLHSLPPLHSLPYLSSSISYLSSSSSLSSSSLFISSSSRYLKICIRHNLQCSMKPREPDSSLTLPFYCQFIPFFSYTERCLSIISCNISIFHFGFPGDVGTGRETPRRPPKSRSDSKYKLYQRLHSCY